MRLCPAGPQWSGRWEGGGVSAFVSASPESDGMLVAAEDFDVLTMCEIWLALDFPEPTTATTAAFPDYEEAP